MANIPSKAPGFVAITACLVTLFLQSFELQVNMPMSRSKLRASTSATPRVTLLRMQRTSSGAFVALSNGFESLSSFEHFMPILVACLQIYEDSSMILIRSVPLIQTVRKLLKVNPAERLSLEACLAHSWLTEAFALCPAN